MVWRSSIVSIVHHLSEACFPHHRTHLLLPLQDPFLWPVRFAQVISEQVNALVEERSEQLVRSLTWIDYDLASVQISKSNHALPTELSVMHFDG